MVLHLIVECDIGWCARPYLLWAKLINQPRHVCS
jgi:hypothetical protein